MTVGFTSRGSMTMGARGAQVEQLQRQLAAAGFNPGTVDGRFGTNTQTAVQAYQRQMGLTVDGLAGRRTNARLRNQGDTFTPAPADKQPVIAQPDKQPVVQPVTGPDTRNVTTAGRVRTPAELARLDNTRVDTQMPDRGPGYQSYYPANHRFGTERTIESVKTIAANYQAATGRTMRIGDISQRGGGRIPDHGAHQNGRNVDVDMQFNDGRTDIERNRNSRNATWQSPAYDRDATRRMIQEIRRVRPNSQILFNDPVLAREGLVRPFPNHDNHLHIQGW